MKRLIKKAAFLFPPIKKRYQAIYDHIEQQNNQIKDLYKDLYVLYGQIDTMSSHYELQNGRNAFLLKKLSDHFDDNINLQLSGNSKRKQWICLQPFTQITVASMGDIMVCRCPDWLKSEGIIGNAYTNTFDEIWNSDIVKKIRYCASQGNFEYCNETYCPILKNPEKYPDIMKHRDSSEYKYDNWHSYHLDNTPTHIHLGCDATCNLKCVCCRNHVHTNSDAENERITYILENFVRQALRDCRELSCLGSGEFLASKPILQFLQTLSKNEFPQLRLAFITNGTLFTQARWNKLENIKGMVEKINVSIDAATKETYEKLRRGGKWDVLCDNMDYISSLKRTGEINQLNISFVIRDENFREMRDFVLLGKRWEVDTIIFQRIKNLGFYASDFYLVQDVFSPENPYYNEAVRMLTELKTESGIMIDENCL